MEISKKFENIHEETIVITRERTVEVKELLLTYIEKVRVSSSTGETIYDRELENENFDNLYNLYRTEKNMVSIEEMKNIMKKYGLSQTDYSLILGFGKVTVNRYINGMIQTDANDSIIRMSKNIRNMKEMAESNCEKVSKEVYKKLYSKLLELERLEEHRKIKELPIYPEKKIFVIENALNVSEKIITVCEDKGIEITHLFLQKILYYVQAISLISFNRPAFDEEILAWEYGPVVGEVYKEYQNYKKNVITSKRKDIKLSEGLEEVIEKVLEGYGIYSAHTLVDLTHEEEPWKNTLRNEIIPKESIKKYFEKVYFID